MDIHINETFSMISETSDIDFSVLIENLFNEEISQPLEKVRRNGGKILFATISIEQKMESLLLHVFMGPFQGPDKRRALFENEILQSTALSYSAKKELVFKAINTLKILPGSDKSKLQTHLKSIMEWRNAFAHGRISHVHERGYFINYYSGGNRSLELNSSYWAEVENVFRECNELLSKALENLKEKEA